MSALFTARYPGECGECGTWFEDGEQVGFDDEHTLLCEDCWCDGYDEAGGES